MKNDLARRLFGGRALPSPGAAEFEVIHRRAGVSVRYYAPAGAPDSRPQPRTPLVLVPPLAADIQIYDRRNQHSLVAYLSARGFDLYLIDWGWPTRADDRRHLSDYFAALLPEMLNRVRFHSGRRRLSLHGWRLGGLLALCYAAVSPADDVAGLVLLDTCIDYAVEPAPDRPRDRLRRQAGRWRRLAGLRASQLPVSALHMPSWLQSIARHAVLGSTQPPDDDALRSRAYPGGVVADVIDHLWTDNALAAGRLPAANAGARLADVKVPILFIADADHPACSPVCGDRLAAVVGSQRVEREWTHGDPQHPACGALMARRSWSRLADWLIALDDEP
ncbi:alpha/beta fold hydrolase [Salinisphaera hydrothermalis]|uniref:alpha/beta fold hydrolase n=1 Tax=Salinisphaera hydrothermalis TaxID=563188 RepID=UPI00333FD49A